MKNVTPLMARALLHSGLWTLFLAAPSWSLVAPKIDSFSHAEATGSTSADLDGNPQPGEVMSIRVRVQNMDPATQSITVQISTPDAYGNVALATTTVPSVAPSGYAWTNVDALQIQIRQNTPCGHRLPVTVAAKAGADPYAAWETDGLLIGAPTTPAASVTHGPLTLESLVSYETDGAWKATSPRRLAVVKSITGTVTVQTHGEGGTLETLNSVGTGSNPGADPRIARGSDGWGMVWVNAGNIYFKKLRDDGTLSSTVAVTATGSASNPVIASDPVVGYVIAYYRSGSVYARRIDNAGSAASLNVELAMATVPADYHVLELVNSYSSGAWSFMSLYYRDASDRLALSPAYFYNDGTRGIYPGYIVDDMSGGAGNYPAVVKAVSSSTDDGRYHYIAFQTFTGIGYGNLFYRRVDLNWSGGLNFSVSSRLTVATSGGFGASLSFGLAKRANDDELSIVYAPNNGTTAATLYQRPIDGAAPVLGSVKTLFGPVGTSKMGNPWHTWIAPDRLLTFFSGGTDADAVNYLATQTGDAWTFEVPMLGLEPKLTDFDQAQIDSHFRAAAAVASDRIGVGTFSYYGGGYHLRILDRNGDPALGTNGVPIPKIVIEATSTSIAIPVSIDVASDGKNFLVLYQPLGVDTFYFVLIDSLTGAILVPKTAIPSTVNDAFVDVNADVEWTGGRYRFVIGRDPAEIWTGTITAAGVHEPGNDLLLGTPTVLDENPELVCVSDAKCFVAVDTRLYVQQTLSTFSLAPALGGTALLMATDGAQPLILRTDGVVERRTPTGAVRDVSPAIPGWITAAAQRWVDLESIGDRLLLFRLNYGLPVVQVLDFKGNPAPGVVALGEIPVASWSMTSTAPPSINERDPSSDLVWSAGGEGYLLFVRRDEYFDSDLFFSRIQLPTAFLQSPCKVANNPPTTAAGGPYAVHIRPGGSPYVLTDGQQVANQATFVGTAADPNFGGAIVSAGWDLNADGIVDRSVSPGADGIVSAGEGTVVVTSAELLSFGFPTNCHGCTHAIRFYATDQLGQSTYSQVLVSMNDQVPPTVVLTTPNGGEAWPATSTQNVTWAASDNAALDEFDLSYVVEQTYLTSTALPKTLTDGTTFDFDFAIPSAFTVLDATIDVDVRWSGSPASATFQLQRVTAPTISVTLLSGVSPGPGTAIGNYDRTLASFGSMAPFQGVTSGSTWRFRLLDSIDGRSPTVYGLKLHLMTSRSATAPTATVTDPAARSVGWTLPNTISPNTRVEILARDTAGNSSFDDSDAEFFMTQANSDQVRTMIVWNEARMRARYPSFQVDALEAKLHDLADHVKIDGVLIDLASGEAAAAGITALYTAWDGTAWNDTVATDNAANVAAANTLATGVRTFLYDKIASTYPNLETLILVGGDVLVPFFRESDSTSLYPETNYPAELASFGYSVSCVGTRSPTWAANCANQFLSDGRYGAAEAKPVPGSALQWWLPDVAVGRLVETPDQIVGLVNTYIAQDGVTIADQVTTTGYDFLTDGGDACYAELSTRLDLGATNLVRLSEALSTWTDTELKNRLFGLGGVAASNFTVIAGHADHRAEGSAGGSGVLTSTQMNTGTSNVAGASILGVGCHTGLSVLADGGPLDLTAAGFQLDLAELFASKQMPVFIGNTGFGWGLSDGVGLGERLLVLVTDEVIRAGQISLGEALRLAKQEYFLRQDRLDTFDWKVLHESTLYGIPNYELRVAKPTPPASEDAATGSWYGVGRDRADLAQQKEDGPRIPGEPWLGDPSWNKKIHKGRKLEKSKVKDVQKDGAADKGLGPDGGASLRVMDFSFQAYDDATQTWQDAYVVVHVCQDDVTGESEPCTGPSGAAGAGQTKIGVYLTLDGQSTGEGGSALQPKISFDSHLAGTELHGILMKGGEFTQPTALNPALDPFCKDEYNQVHPCFDPVIGNPETEVNTPEGPGPTAFLSFASPTAFLSFASPTPNGFDESNGNGNSTPVRWDNLNAPMAELVRRGAKGAGPSREEIYSEWVYRTRDFTQFYSNSLDVTPPTIGAFTHDCLADEAGNDCFSTLTGLTLNFDVTVTDPGGDGVYKVFVTHTSDIDSTGAGAWQTFELAPLGGGVFGGSLAIQRTTSYFVQAVDWAGNVATVNETGDDESGSGALMGSTYAFPRVVSALVPDGDLDGLPDVYEDSKPCLNKLVANGGLDPDFDYLSSLIEFEQGLEPCSADSDGGGDNDGSERAHGRNPKSPGDDLDLTIQVTKAGSTYTVDWNSAFGQNSQIDGYYHVYRRATPYGFHPVNDKIAGPLSDATTTFGDPSPPCDTTPPYVCFYKVWNVAITALSPVVNFVSPGSGPANTATPIQLFGSNFAAGSAVEICGVAATNVVVVNASQITASTPLLPAQTCMVKVRSQNGQEGQLAGGFTYQ